MPAVPPLIKPIIDVLVACQLDYRAWGSHADPNMVSQDACGSRLAWTVVDGGKSINPFNNGTVFRRIGYSPIKIIENPNMETKRKFRYDCQYKFCSRKNNSLAAVDACPYETCRAGHRRSLSSPATNSHSLIPHRAETSPTPR